MPDDFVPAHSRVQQARQVWPALVAFVAIRIVGVLALWGAAVASGDARKAPYVLLSRRWDSLWYSRIAANGYGYSVHTRAGDLHSDLAFFPLLPLLERAGHAARGWAVGDVGLGVGVVASVLSAAGIFAVARVCVRRADPTSDGVRAATLAVVLWAALPVGVVQWMAYSESLFTALAAWALYCVLTRRWVWAGALASLAGLTRPVGLGVVLAVWVGVLMLLWHRRSDGRGVSTGATRESRAEVVRAVFGALLAPLGLAGYVLWVAHRTGRGLAGYLDVQAGWRNGFDGEMTFVRFIGAKFTSPAGAAAGVGLLLAVALATWAVVACFRLGRGGRGTEQEGAALPWPVITYVVVLVALALGAKGYFGSKPRFFVPIFPLLFPPAVWLAARMGEPVGSAAPGARTRSRTAVVAGLALLVLGSAAFGTFWLDGSGPP